MCGSLDLGKFSFMGVSRHYEFQIKWSLDIYLSLNFHCTKFDFMAYSLFLFQVISA